MNYEDLDYHSEPIIDDDNEFDILDAFFDEYTTNVDRLPDIQQFKQDISHFDTFGQSYLIEGYYLYIQNNDEYCQHDDAENGICIDCSRETEYFK